MNYITSLPEAEPLDGTELIEVAQLSPTIAISAATISAAAADNSFNDSANGFVAAGFAVNDRVNVQGFTGDVANNILVGIIGTLTTGKMTILSTEGDVIVDDAAGETVVITKWETKRFLIDDLPGSGAGDMLAANNLSDVANPVTAGANIKPREQFVVAISDETTAITAGTGKTSWGFGYDFTITEVYILLGAAQSSSGDVQVDINKNGVTIFSTEPVIQASESTSLTGTAAVIDVATSTKGDIFTADIVSAGTGAKGLKAVIVGYRT